MRNFIDIPPPISSTISTQADKVDKARRLTELRNEYQDYQKKMVAIQMEAQSIFNELKGIVPSGYLPQNLEVGFHKKEIKNPRPEADKLTIAAGRAVARLIETKKAAGTLPSMDQCKQVALQAATSKAKKLQITLSPEIIEHIYTKVQKRFSL